MKAALPIESILRRDRFVVGLCLITLTGLAWLYLYNMAQSMASMKVDGTVGEMAMTTANGADYFMTFIMWAVMMVGMMIPSATPMILTFALVNRKRSESGKTFVPTGIFLSAYLACWALFSLIAAGAQTTFYKMSWLNPNDQTVTPIIGACLLIAAGLFQLSALKNICLKH